jgi:hypothetical protein
LFPTFAKSAKVGNPPAGFLYTHAVCLNPRALFHDRNMSELS